MTIGWRSWCSSSVDAAGVGALAASLLFSGISSKGKVERRFFSSGVASCEYETSGGTSGFFMDLPGVL